MARVNTAALIISETLSALDRDDLLGPVRARLYLPVMGSVDVALEWDIKRHFVFSRSHLHD